MKTSKSLFKFVKTICVITTIVISLSLLVITPNSVKAEEETTNHSFTLSEALSKITYTEEELSATGMTLKNGVLGSATSSLSQEQLALKESFYKTAFGRSPLKIYSAFKDAYVQKEYWQWAIDKSNSYRFSYTHVAGLSAGHDGATGSRINASSQHCIYYTGTYLHAYSFGWTAPADGTLTIPEHTLALETAAVFKLGFSKDNGSRTTLSPSDSSLGWVDYKTGTHTIDAQTFNVRKGEMVYINMYADGSNGWITYNPTFSFTEIVTNTVTYTLSEQIGKVAYTEEEKTASGWDGSTRDANKLALYKTAFEKSDLKYYVGVKNTNYAQKEYYTYCNTGSSYYMSYTHINGLCAGNSGTTSPRLDSDGGIYIYNSSSYDFVWSIAWIAPQAGTLTIPAHTMYMEMVTDTTALKLGWSKGSQSILSPTNESLNMLEYSADGTYSFEEQVFEVKAGDVIYLSMYSVISGTSGGTYMNYDPTYVFEPTTNPCELYGHTEEVIVGKAATCTEAGLSDGKKCSVCEEVLVAQEEVAALGHTNADAVKENEVASTCKVAGSYDSVVYCSICNEELSRTTETLELAAHKEVIDEAIAATCTEKGKTEGKHCSVCEEVLVAQEEVAALGHTNTDAVKENEVASTCKVAGSYDSVVYCSVCNEELSRTTETLELALHKEVIDEAIAATCTEKGKTAGKHCSVCEEVLVAQEEVAALGHTNADAVKENEVASTCKVAGSYDSVVYCSVCDEELSRTKEALELLEHTEETIAAVEATCETTGLTEGKKCSVCDEVIIAQEEVAPLGHTYGSEYKYDETHHWNECSCGETNEKVAHSGGTATETEKAICEVCGQPYGELKPQANPLAGCTGSIVSTLFGVISLAGIAIVLKRKRKE